MTSPLKHTRAAGAAQWQAGPARVPRGAENGQTSQVHGADLESVWQHPRTGTRHGVGGQHTVTVQKKENVKEQM